MKAILVIDMPSCCADCRFKDSSTFMNEITFYCHASGDVLICNIDEEIDSICPLKPMPQPREMTEIDSIYNPWIDENAIGFNECLAEILGEEE